MKKFLTYIFFLILPFFVILPLPLYCLWSVGELMPFDSYIHPLNKNQLWGLAYNYYDREYKYFMTEYLKPDVIELGTSRSMQVEENIINNRYSFYNAGGAVQNSEDYLEFIKTLKYDPTLIIIDINQFFFNPKSEKTAKAVYEKPKLTSLMVINGCKRFYDDLLDGKIKLDRLADNNNIGLLARMKLDGFTRTGTRYNDLLFTKIEECVDYNFEDTMSRIRNHDRRFQTCNEADTSVVYHIDAFLKECKKRGIMVIGLLPPFAHKVNEFMKKEKNYQYLSQIYGLLLPSFDGRTQFLFDYTDATKVEGEDYDFQDGFHAGVIINNLIFKDIISKNSQLSDFFVAPELIDSINLEYRKVHPKFHDLPSLFRNQAPKIEQKDDNK